MRLELVLLIELRVACAQMHRPVDRFRLASVHSHLIDIHDLPGLMPGFSLRHPVRPSSFSSSAGFVEEESAGSASRLTFVAFDGDPIKRRHDDGLSADTISNDPYGAFLHDSAGFAAWRVLQRPGDVTAKCVRAAVTTNRKGNRYKREDRRRHNEADWPLGNLRRSTNLPRSG